MKLKIVLILLLLFSSSRVLAQEPRAQLYHKKANGLSDEGPSLVGHSFRMMKTAGFWISRHPSPDAVILAPAVIDQFNAGLRHKKLTKDIFTIVQNLNTETLSDDLVKTLADISGRNYYTTGGLRADKDFMDDVKNNMDLSSIVTGVPPRYGLVVHYTSVRFLPTREGLYEQRKDYDFDQLQNSALDVGTPAAIVHASLDGLWYYVMTEISDGWVEAKDIAIGDVNQVREFSRTKDFAVVIRPKADIFLNGSMTDDDDYVRMGMRLPLAGVDAGRATVKVPVMGEDGSLAIKEAYMNAEDVNPGFLAFTARNIYKQALMMLNQPYGWGDMFGEQDCSRFLQMVFATMGIILPRDSKDQAQVSSSVVDFDENSKDAVKIASLAKLPAAHTLLVLKGHIMLYLGTIDGKPYAIHDTTGYKQKVGQKEVTNALDRVVISDLSLGQGTQKGSLLKRLTRAVTIE